MVSLKKKNLHKKIFFFYLFSMQLFSADATMFSNFFFFFDHKKLKKPPSKVAHNRPKPFLRQSSPGHSPQPRSSFPFYKKSIATLSLLLSDYIIHYLIFLTFGSCFSFQDTGSFDSGDEVIDFSSLIPDSKDDVILV